MGLELKEMDWSTSGYGTWILTDSEKEEGMISIVGKLLDFNAVFMVSNIKYDLRSARKVLMKDNFYLSWKINDLYNSNHVRHEKVFNTIEEAKNAAYEECKILFLEKYFIKPPTRKICIEKYHPDKFMKF